MEMCVYLCEIGCAKMSSQMWKLVTNQELLHALESMFLLQRFVRDRHGKQFPTDFQREIKSELFLPEPN